MNTFTIKDLESLSGIKAHTIRIWEQRYSFLKPQRTDTNIRYYSNEELIKLLNVALLNKYGYKISHIANMQAAEIEQKLVSLSSAEAHNERYVNELIELMVTTEILSFEKKIDEHIRLRGIEKCISQIIFPFLEKIGILWVTAHINPAQEHLVSNVIRQKIIRGIEDAEPRIPKPGKEALLFLPESEHHELSLLYLHYVLKVQGLNVYYIGANVPLKDLVFILQKKKPTFSYCHITAPGKGFNAERFLRQFSEQLPEHPLYVGGAYVQNIRGSYLNITQCKSFNDVITRLTRHFV